MEYTCILDLLTSMQNPNNITAVRALSINNYNDLLSRILEMSRGIHLKIVKPLGFADCTDMTEDDLNIVITLCTDLFDL